jgi:hypothetical protein
MLVTQIDATYQRHMELTRRLARSQLNVPSQGFPAPHCRVLFASVHATDLTAHMREVEAAVTATAAAADTLISSSISFLVLGLPHYRAFNERACGQTLWKHMVREAGSNSKTAGTLAFSESFFVPVEIPRPTQALPSIN